jgi:hypothetical protein
MSELIKELSRIQQALKAPKGQFNKFGNYKYRSCEDILEAVKPLLNECVLTLSDSVEQIGDRFYILAFAQLRLGEETIDARGFAREQDSKKGMDAAQLTGATSSYARKYALNGLLLIDDNKDADTQDNTNEGTHTGIKKPSEKQLNLASDLMVKKNFTTESAKKWLGDNFQRGRLAELTSAEISKAIQMLQG